LKTIDFNRSDFYSFKKKILFRDFSLKYKKMIIKQKNIINSEIEDISSLDYIRNNSIVFINKNFMFKNLKKNNVQIVTNSDEVYNYHNSNVTLVNDLNALFNYTSNELFLHDDHIEYYDEFENINNSQISKFAEIEDSVSIGKNCFIGKGVKIGKNSIIKNNVVIKSSIIGENSIIGDNTTIGSTGFGFDFKNRGATNLHPHLGIVLIGENVRIGSNCTIDRGKLDFTIIDENCMLDNLIHIAHNVKISKNCCIAAQSGISGSVKIGKNVTIGGQVGLAGHIEIGDNVIIAAKSGVTKNVADNSTIAGFPAMDIRKWKYNIINERKNRYK